MSKLLLMFSLFGALNIFALNIFAQQVWILDMKFMTCDQEPISAKFINLNSEENEYSWAFTDEEGVGRFVIDSLPSDLDSLFLIFDEEKINFNNLSLLETYTNESHSIKVVYLRHFTNEEFDRYTKEKKLMPPRSKD